MSSTMEGMAERSKSITLTEDVDAEITALTGTSTEAALIPLTDTVVDGGRLTQIDGERANQLTHGAALAMSFAGSVFLLTGVIPDGDFLQIAGVLIYSVTNLALFSASVLSHSFVDKSRRDFWRTADQVCIFLMMAGTFTPVAFASCRDGWSSGLIVGMWMVALVGIGWKVIFLGLDTVPVWFYVLLGSIPLLATDRLFATLGTDGISWIAAGGVSYLVGLCLFLNDHRAEFLHAGWHVCVTVGSVCHYMVVLDCSLC